MEEKKLNPNISKSYIKNKNILISGAGGSVGSELSKQVLNLNPKKLILLDNSEFNLFTNKKEINQIIQNKNINIEVNFILGSINDSNLLNKIFSDNIINTIFHAAAYKHVDLVENNVVSAINNNIFGTYKLANYAKKFQVNNFVLISTDKAVNPSNIMGKTKRISELIIQSLSKTLRRQKIFNRKIWKCFWTSGRYQILNNKLPQRPATITHKDVTRYFMTIKEAAQLVIEATSLQSNGKVFILIWVNQSKLNLAEKLIRFYGFNVKSNKMLKSKNDIEIKFIGLKKGEKLHETLSTSNKLEKSKRSKIFVANESSLNWNEIENN